MSLSPDLNGRRIVLALIGRLRQHEGHGRDAIVISQQHPVDDAVGVGSVQVEPAVIFVLIERRVFRMTVSREQMPVIKLLDTLRYGVQVFAGLVRIAVAAHHLDQVIEVAVTLSDVAAPAAALLRAIRQCFLDPPFVRADVTQVDGGQENLDALLGGFADDPVYVLEVLLVGRGKVAGGSEWGPRRSD